MIVIPATSHTRFLDIVATNLLLILVETLRIDNQFTPMNWNHNTHYRNRNA